MINNHINNHGRAQHGGDGVEGQDARIAGEDAQEVARQCHHTAEQEGGGQEGVVIGRAEKQAGNMGHRKPDEGNGSTERRRDRRQQPRGEQQEVAGTAHVHAQILRIARAEQESIQRLHERDCQRQAREDGAHEERQLLRRDPAEIAQAPNEVGMHPFRRGKEVQKGDERRGEVAQHDADDEEHEVALRKRREEEQRPHHRRRAEERPREHRHEAREGERPRRDAPPAEEHHQGDAEARPGVDAEDGRPREGVGEHGLEHQPGHRQRRPAEQRRHRLGEARLPEDEPPALALHGRAAKHVPHRLRGDAHGACPEVGGKEGEHRQRQRPPPRPRKTPARHGSKRLK